MKIIVCDALIFNKNADVFIFNNNADVFTLYNYHVCYAQYLLFSKYYITTN